MNYIGSWWPEHWPHRNMNPQRAGSYQRPLTFLPLGLPDLGTARVGALRG